jgi:CRISPR-associated protein Cas2
MLILVTYDVSTETPAGRRRLRRVAKICLNHGQRVQKSVFECQVDLAQMETLEDDLLDQINLEEDNLRIYRLHEPLIKMSKSMGNFAPPISKAPLWLEREPPALMKLQGIRVMHNSYFNNQLLSSKPQNGQQLRFLATWIAQTPSLPTNNQWVAMGLHHPLN